jgi:hypothetical protein
MAERFLEPSLGDDPERATGTPFLLAKLGHHDTAYALVERINIEDDEPVALQRAKIVAKRGAVHPKLEGKLVHGREPFPLASGSRQDRILRHFQAFGRKVGVIELRHPPRGHTQGRGTAMSEALPGRIVHYVHIHMICVDMHIYTPKVNGQFGVLRHFEDEGAVRRCGEFAPDLQPALSPLPFASHR